MTGRAALLLSVLAIQAGMIHARAQQPARIADPYYHSSNSWGQGIRDQWAFDAIGMTDPAAVWDALGPSPSEVTVAVIDTGIDWNHLDLSWGSLWVNEDEIIGNGADDDGNGYIDDKIGWDFLTNSNQPWDYDGHGTFIAGLIAAESSNGIGITGLNPHARIMVLKAVNNFGRTRSSFIAEAIGYAVDNGARIINLSVGGAGISQIETTALDYAAEHGVLIVVAAGNEGQALEDYGLAGHPAVLTVTSTGPDGMRTDFSNWGPQVSLAAPGVDILSLRARATDLLLNMGDTYQAGSAFVGPDRRYYRATGTSFSAPLVTAAASLLWSRDPGLSAEQVKRLLLQSARDIGAPGVDQFSGHGLLDVSAAMSADASAFVEAAITAVDVVQLSGGPAASILGTARSDELAGYTVEIGAGAKPQEWEQMHSGTVPVMDGELAIIPAASFAGQSVWTIRLRVRRAGGDTGEARFKLTLGR